MGRRLFFVLPVLFVFSLLFVQVSEAGGATPGNYTFTITKIGFYTSGEPKGQGAGGGDPQSQNIVELPSSQTVRYQIGGATAPSISDFVYTGNIPNGSFMAIGCYAVSSTEPDGFEPTWLVASFDNPGTPVEHTFTDSSRKSIKFIFKGSVSYATVTDL